jgi:hypothetical protein
MSQLVASPAGYEVHAGEGVKVSACVYPFVASPMDSQHARMRPWCWELRESRAQ